MILSRRSKYAINHIEDDDAIAAQLERNGKRVIKLNRGDPAVYFDTPGNIKQAYIKAIKKNRTYYTDNTGIPELKDAIVKRYKSLYSLNLDHQSIITTQGVSEALYVLNATLLNRRDHAILFRPYYSQYMPYIKLEDGNAYCLDYVEKKGWSIDTQELERHIKKMKEKKSIKYILLTNPNNPTGTVLDRKTLKAVADLANEHDLILVSDEIYDEIVYNGAKFTSVSQVAKGQPYVILNGASKNYDATGFRIGFMIIPEHDSVSMEIKKKFADFANVRISDNTPAQYAMVEGIGNIKTHKKEIKKMVLQIQDRINFSVKLLNENPYLSTVRPNGAYYIFPRVDLKSLNYKRDKEFVEDFLREKYVQLSKGSGFGVANHVRLVGLAPKPILEQAITRLNEFCEKKAK